MQLSRLADLGILGRNGRTGDDDFGCGDVIRVMSLKNGRAQTGESLGYGGSLEVGAGDLVAEVQQHFGNAAHADAADSHEMNALDFREHKSTSSPRIYADERG